MIDIHLAVLAAMAAHRSAGRRWMRWSPRRVDVLRLVAGVVAIGAVVASLSAFSPRGEGGAGPSGGTAQTVKRL